MTAGTRIAQRVKRGLERAGQRTGSGPYLCTIRRASTVDGEPRTPWDEPASPPNDPTDYEVTAFKEETTSRYMDGTLIGELRRVVMIEATGVRPKKSDKVAVGVANASVTANTVFEEILEIETLEPTDTPFMYGLHLAV